MLSIADGLATGTRLGRGGGGLAKRWLPSVSNAGHGLPLAGTIATDVGYSIDAEAQTLTGQAELAGDPPSLSGAPPGRQDGGREAA